MKRKLVQEILQFLRKHSLVENSNKVPCFGVAYSGGADSKALLYLLLECRKYHAFSLHILHIDHSWRKTSACEAKQIESEILNLNLPFHLKTLEKPRSTKNIEERARDERLKFFSEITNLYNLDGIFLAHHADDAAETVLKRVLEGAHLPFLSGLRPLWSMRGLTLLRPLLPYSKKNLEDFLKEEKLCYIEDSTNFDTRFLRARMRENILPELAKSFGKEISKNLYLLGTRTLELHEYLNRKIEGCFPKEIKKPWGSLYDFSLISIKEPIELTHLFIQLFSKEKICLSKERISFFVDCFLKKKTNKRFLIGDVKIIWDKNYLFILKEEIPSFEGKLELSLLI